MKTLIVLSANHSVLPVLKFDKLLVQFPLIANYVAGMVSNFFVNLHRI